MHQRGYRWVLFLKLCLLTSQPHHSTLQNKIKYQQKCALIPLPWVLKQNYNTDHKEGSNWENHKQQLQNLKMLPNQAAIDPFICKKFKLLTFNREELFPKYQWYPLIKHKKFGLSKPKFIMEIKNSQSISVYTTVVSPLLKMGQLQIWWHLMLSIKVGKRFISLR